MLHVHRPNHLRAQTAGSDRGWALHVGKKRGPRYATEFVHLSDRVIQYKLLDCEDFEFPDQNPLRFIGDRHPRLVAFAEKEVLDQMARPFGATWCAAKG